MVRSRGRGAFTMVEVMVSAAIGTVLLGVLYSTFSTSSKIDRRVEAKNELVQSATLAVETLKRDLAELVTIPVDPAKARYGDSRNPVYISDDGRQVSFYITMKGDDSRTPEGKVKLDRINYHLRPVARQNPDDPVSFFLVRSQGSEGDEPQEAAQAATGLRNLGAVYLEEMQFTLLSPFEKGTGSKPHLKPSPDDNFYVETQLVATTSGFKVDSAGKKSHDTLEMRLLSPLEQPSQQSKVPNVGIATAQYYEPTPAPLKKNPSNLVSLSPPEEKAIADLQGLSNKFEQGSIPPAELEKQVRAILADVLKNNPTSPVLTGPSNPPPVDQLKLDPNAGTGQPVLSTPEGDKVVLPPATGSSPAPASDPGNQTASGTRTWTVTKTTTTKTYTRDPVTGNLVLVDSSSASTSTSGGETVTSTTGMVNVSDLEAANKADINKAIDTLGGPSSQGTTTQ